MTLVLNCVIAGAQLELVWFGLHLVQAGGWASGAFCIVLAVKIEAICWIGNGADW